MMFKSTFQFSFCKNVQNWIKSPQAKIASECGIREECSYVKEYHGEILPW